MTIGPRRAGHTHAGRVRSARVRAARDCPVRPARGRACLTLVLLVGAALTYLYGDDPAGSGVPSLSLRTDATGAVAVTQLDGDWAFSPNRLIGPGSPMTDTVTVPVPSGWHLVSATDMGRYGYGTYAVRVLVPDGAAGRAGTYALRVRQISAAGEVYWNGQLIYRSGQPARSADAEEPAWLPDIVLLPGLEAENELRVLVSNFRDVAPGITSSMTIGPAPVLYEQQRRSLAGAIFIAGVLAIMGIYHVMLYRLRRSDRATLWFSLFLLAVSLRVLVVDQLPLVQIIGGIDYGLLLRLSYITYPLPVALVVTFVSALYPEDTWRRPLRVLQVLSLAMAGLVLLLPVRGFIVAAQYFHPVAGGAGVLVVGVMIRAVRARRDAANLFAAGIVILTATAVHDILRALSIVSTPMLVPFATLVFVLVEALVLARQHTLALTRAEATSRSLAEVNRAVERFVPHEMLKLMGLPDVTRASLGQVSQLDMAVLFLDIRGFTTISERLGPEASYRFVNRFLSTMGPIIREAGGVVDKYTGDGLLALFPDGPSAAIPAALLLRAARERIIAETESDLPGPLEYGIGVHTGELMVGTIGEAQRMDTSAISDTVNLASRIESLTKVFGVGLAVSSSVFRRLNEDERVNSRFLGKLPIRGKADSVAVFEMFGGEAPEVQEQRAQTANTFERGVVSYFLEDFADACTAFQEVLSVYPQDRASQRYLDLAERQVPPQLGILAGSE